MVRPMLPVRIAMMRPFVTADAPLVTTARVAGLRLAAVARHERAASRAHPAIIRAQARRDPALVRYRLLTNGEHVVPAGLLPGGLILRVSAGLKQHQGAGG